jgi:hypothetical protein
MVEKSSHSGVIGIAWIDYLVAAHHTHTKIA